MKISFELAHPLLECVLTVGRRHETRHGSFKRLATHLVQARRTNAEMLACLLDGHLAREGGKHGPEALFEICGPFDSVDMSEPDGRTSKRCTASTIARPRAPRGASSPNQAARRRFRLLDLPT